MENQNEDQYVSVAEFEASVLEMEDIIIRVRAPIGAKVLKYPYQRKAAGSQSVSEFIEGRIKPLLCGYEFSIIDGNYGQPHGRLRLENLRDSYAQNK